MSIPSSVIAVTASTFFLLNACTADVACEEQIIAAAPTVPAAVDPDLTEPKAAVAGAGDSVFCVTATPVAAAATGVVSAHAANVPTILTLDQSSQVVKAAAVGDDMLAVAWRVNDQIFLAVANSGDRFQIRTLGSGARVALVYSAANRLHIVTEHAGHLYYRAADAGVHPADVEPEYVADGASPAIVLDQYSYAHIVFERDGLLYQAAQVMENSWNIAPITGAAFAAATPSFVARGSGIGLTFHIGYSAPDNTVHLARWQTTPYGLFPTWQPLTSFALAANETLLGRVQLASARTDGVERIVATWVTRRAASGHSTPPAFAQPRFEAVNPLYPHAIANPQQLHSGLNAVRWHNQAADSAPFAAGLYQTIAVENLSFPVSLSAQGRGEATASPLPYLQIGIDPTGGTNPNAATVRWSAAAAPDKFQPFSATARPTGPTATLFLHAQHEEKTAATAIWDSVTLHNGFLQNGGFEEAFEDEHSSDVPAGWSAYYEDSGSGSAAERDLYRIYATWSDDGGSTWSGPTAVVENRDASGAVSGALGAAAFPLIALSNATPTVSLFYIYAAGDPPPNSEFIRYGRPYSTLCSWGMADCSATPGVTLIDRDLIAPTTALLLAPDSFDPRRALLVLETRQADVVNTDVQATFVVLR